VGRIFGRVFPSCMGLGPPAGAWWLLWNVAAGVGWCSHLAQSNRPSGSLQAGLADLRLSRLLASCQGWGETRVHSRGASPRGGGSMAQGISRCLPPAVLLPVIRALPGPGPVGPRPPWPSTRDGHGRLARLRGAWPFAWWDARALPAWLSDVRGGGGALAKAGLAVVSGWPKLDAGRPRGCRGRRRPVAGAGLHPWSVCLSPPHAASRPPCPPTGC